MTVCRYFMQGNCRYGNTCRFEHPTGGNQGYSVTAQRQLFGGGNKNGQGGRGQGQVNFGQNRFKWISPDVQQQQQNKQSAATAQLSTSEIVSALRPEIQTMFEEGKMWPFTCIGFEKELPSLPGFDDLSMEEMRLEAYEAQKSGTVPQFQQRFQSLVNDMMTKKQDLKAPSMTVKQKLFLFIDDARRKTSSGSSGQTSLFTGSSNNGLFGGGSSGGLFGSSQTSSQSGSGLFGSSQMSSQSGSGLFGSSQTNSQSGSGLFGSSQTSGQSGSGLFASKDQTGPFGQSGQASLFGKSTFGQSTSTFGQPASVGQSGGFGQSTQPQSGQMFGQSIMGQTTTIFGQQTSQPTSTFGQPQTPKANLFGKSESPLKSATFQTPSSATSQTFFGSPTISQASAPKPAVQAEPEDSAYSQVVELTAEELEQFKSATFTLGQIPTKTPPRELCFTISQASAPKPAVQAEPEDSAYSQVVELTAEELEQFKSATFTLGQIPTKPPPRELCF